MAHDNRASNITPHSTVPAMLDTKKTAPRSSDQARLNRMNMEKMIMKNVAASRNSTKNRAQQILEAFKRKRQQEDDLLINNADEVERAAKRKKSSPPHSDTAAKSAVAASILSPSRRGTGPSFTSPTRRQNHSLNFKSPTPPKASPARASTVKALHLSSPMRPPRSSVTASPARPTRSVHTASPLRRTEFLTSPLRHRASASPKRPLVFDDNAMAGDATASSTRINGHPLLLSSQLEVAPVAKASKALASTKSPFQSIQAKFNKSTANAISSPQAREELMQVNEPRSGPIMVSLTNTEITSVQRTAIPTAVSTAPSNAPNNQISTSISASSTLSTLCNADASSASIVATVTTPSPPVRKLFPSSRQVVAQRSICFSTESVATAVDVTPDGEIVVVGFMDGSIRLYEMDSSIPSDRHGYLLGHLDEQSSQGSGNVHMRVKISTDGRYIFAGDRQRKRVVMSINLDHYRNEKDSDDEDFQQFKKHFCSNAKLRGFADVTTYTRPNDPLLQDQERKSIRSAYYLLTGLGVGNLNLWRFVEPAQSQQNPTWEYLQTFVTGGNTAMMAVFLPSSVSPGFYAVATSCRDKNLRLWPMEFNKASYSSSEKVSDDTMSSPFMDNTCMVFRYWVFELEKLGGGGSSKSRRSNIMLESLAASDDGKTVVAVSSEGIFYYSNKLPGVGSNEAANLRIIGKNASENMLFKAPMKVYTPKVTVKDCKIDLEAMMAVVTNPGGEDIEQHTGYINVDPTEAFAARWMVPSRGQNCWVCEVRNVSHWAGPPECKAKRITRPPLAAEQKGRIKAQRRQERTLNRSNDVAVKHQIDNNEQNSDLIAVKTKMMPSSSSRKIAQDHSTAEFNANVGDQCESAAVQLSSHSSRGLSKHCGTGYDDDEDNTGSDDDPLSIVSLMSELEHFKKRNAEIKTEWQRRLQGERQLRRKWKQREEEFLDQLNDSLTKLDAAETEAERLSAQLRDAEKRSAFEKSRVEQDNSVKSRYEQLCEHMNDKMALITDQKRLLEQTTRSLLAEVDRNVHALKCAVILEKSECVVCKDQQAVTAIVPCGHLCFCEQDAETYRLNCTTECPTCPICQQEIVSMLRIYT
ncbi:hypothetical protein PPTG_13884 [Plasmopara halstedii]|uniref:RING-type domain-containing protein n=1 Tax=Plasmopara halstedii TaxID=4781 RepID=A0A0P1B6B8_PLAHL|nr:hypothetical protein PPTG_13884 [Plasmopara halstedii]CEG49094.1 hypothetical protein PPTG_13884 [Plasmopara halstedii]|eukprot:XP_024585463.1 hypothetical protein PPTG_13884 [Plasmopara halstedii]